MDNPMTFEETLFAMDSDEEKLALITLMGALDATVKKDRHLRRVAEARIQEAEEE